MATIVEDQRYTSVEMSHKFIDNYDDLSRVIESHRLTKHSIVATIGSYDLLHVGHLRYLTSAKMRGDILVVGTDTDRVIRDTKGDLRPLIPFEERVEMLAYQGCVDLITPLDDVENKQWQHGLLKAIRPDTFVAEGSSFTKEELEAIEGYCGKVVVLPRQAESTSSTLIVQNSVKAHIDRIYEVVTQRPR